MGTCTRFTPDDPLHRALPPRRPPPPPPPLPPPPDLPGTLPPPPPDEPAAVPLRAAVEFACLYPVIRRTVRVLHSDRSTADDVTQMAALRVLVLWYRFSPPPGTVDVRRARRQWAATVTLLVVRQWRNAAAAKKRSGEIATDPAEVEAALRGHVPSAEALAIGRETLRELEDATTPERWRAFYMFHAEGHTTAGIAAEMGARVSTVYTWIRCATEDLRAYLARRDAAERRGK
jgi:DNA-directed RNA polymerase specialized sigma24 family protein